MSKRSQKMLRARVPRRQTTSAFIENYLNALSCDKSSEVLGLIASKSFADITKLEFDPKLYDTAEEARAALAATSFLRKSTFLPTGIDKKAAALEKFFEFEEQCRKTNNRIVNYNEGGSEPPHCLHTLIPRVQRKIAAILGDFDFDEMVSLADWGPGVSTLLKGATSVRPIKYHDERGATLEIITLMEDLLPLLFPSWFRPIDNAFMGPVGTWRLEPQFGNSVITVDKDARADRVIAVEPGFNLYFQKGIGELIKKRLLRVGIDISTQQLVNRTLASVAHKLGLATIDFSSASDSIAREVVKLLLPEKWFRVMDAFRSKRGRLDEQDIYWEKFSSMGNGFTFELETLIFHAIALVTTSELNELDLKVSTFGDDVILPQKAADTFIEVCTLLGFTVNTRKSFLNGRFFESCGGYYFDGHDVTPFFFKEELDVNSAESVYKVHNAVMQQAVLWGTPGFRVDRFKKIIKKLRASLPERDFLIVPPLFGDVGFHGNVDEVLSLKTTRHYSAGYLRIAIRTPKAKTFEYDLPGLLLDKLASMGADRVQVDVHNWAHYRRQPSRLRTDWYRSLSVTEAISRGNAVEYKGVTVSKKARAFIWYSDWADLGAWE